MHTIKTGLRLRDLEHAASWARFATLYPVTGWGIYYLIGVDPHARPILSAFVSIGEYTPALVMIAAGLILRALVQPVQWRLVSIFLVCGVLMGAVCGLFLATTWRTTAVWTYSVGALACLRAAVKVASIPFKGEVEA